MQGVFVIGLEMPATYSVFLIGQEDYDVDVAWERGLALTMLGPTCLRAVCFLCGSAGRGKVK